jgi:hypothetical protein
MNLYDATIPVFTKTLTAIEGWLDKAVAYAEAKKFDPEVLLNARLAPDQFAFIRQVQIACDNTKFIAARLTGKDAPSNPDTEKTVADLRARIKTHKDYLASFKREDFNGAEERAISQQAWQGKTMRGGDYLDHYALPNLYFHVTTAYAILRHNGVELGKRDFLGQLPFKG